MRLSATWTCLSLIILPLYSQTCPYQTVAGPARSFVGDGIDAKSARLSGPSRAVVAADGTIYFSDTWNHRIRRVDPAGVIHTVARTGERAFKGDNGAALQAAFNQPTRLALASDGSLYISDTGNSRVRKISPNGTISTVAGNGHNRFDGDGGPGPQASLNAPTALALDAKGNLYILDSGNWRVRMLAPDGTISTVAGAGGDEDYSYLLQTLEQTLPRSPPCKPESAGSEISPSIAIRFSTLLWTAWFSRWARMGSSGR